MADFTGGTDPEPHLLTADTADFLKEASVLLEVGEGQGTASPGETLVEYQIPIPESPDTEVTQILRGKGSENIPHTSPKFAGVGQWKHSNLKRRTAVV